MKITETVFWRLCISDIETLKGATILGFFNPDEEKWYKFEISRRKNQIYEFVSFYRRTNWDYMVGYNYLGFDSQVIQFILNNYEKWHDFDGHKIAGIVYEFVQDLIGSQSFNNRKRVYYDNQLEIPIIDVFTLLGLNGEARWSSLKKCEFQIDWYSVEEMPIEHTIEHLTDEQIDVVSSYMENDIMATYEVFKIALGQTDHPVYKDNNQIELRISIKEEFGLECMNLSDIDLGDALMKKSYAEEKGIELREIPYKGFFRKKIYLKDCIPSYVEFKTDYFKNLLQKVQKRVITQTEEFEIPIKFYGRNYTLARGGLHADQKFEIWKADEDHLIEDDDVASYYPRIIINNKIYPQHLGPEMLKIYKQRYDQRVELKPLAKTDKKIKGIVEALKLQLNAIFGKLGSMESWLYDAKSLFSVTLAGEFTLLMLIEEFELNGINVISANTDGVTTRFHKDKKELKDKIVKEWMEKTAFEIETVRFKSFYYQSVNDYLAVKEDGKIKKKGDFITDFELYKNKSSRVIPLAVEEYLTKGTDPVQFIENHENVYDFCIMSKATGKLYLEMQRGEEVNTLKKLVRYYVSADSEWQLFKRGINKKGKPMNKNERAPTELGTQYIRYFNQFEKMDDYKIDRRPYILKALSIIDNIEKTKRKKRFIEEQSEQKQLSLF